MTSSQSLAFRNDEKSPSAFRTISEVANELDVPQHVLRFWESKFSQIKPLKRGGGRRYYRPEDIGLLRSIRNLLYHDGYTIKGVQRLLREGGAKSVIRKQGEELAAKDSLPGAASGVAGEASRRLPAQGRGGSASAALGGRARAELKEVLGELEELRDLLRGR